MEFPRQEYWNALQFPYPGDLLNPGTEPGSPQRARFFTVWATREQLDAWYSRSIHSRMLSHFSHIQLFVTPMDHSLPGSSAHGILHTRILEWVAMPSSMGSSPPWDWTHVSRVSCIGGQVPYHRCHLGSPSRSVAKSFN